MSVREVIDCVERVTGRAGPRHRRAAASGRPGRPVRVERQDQARARLDAALSSDLDVIVETAWRWRERPSASGYSQRSRADAKAAVRERAPAAAAAALLAAVPRPAVRRRSSRCWSTPAPPAGVAYLIAADHRPRPAGPGRRAPFRIWAGSIIVAYLVKGLGSYFSTYLMTDVGQRVVRDIRDRLFRAHPRSVGRLLQPAHDRPADVAHHERRQPGPAGGLGDGRRPDPRRAAAVGWVVAMF